MRLTIRGIVDAVLLLTGVAALVIAVERHEWALFALSLAISLLILVFWGLRLALRSSARLWTKSLMWRYSPHGGRTALAAGWLLKRVLGDSSDTVRAYDSLVWSGNSSSPKRPLLAPMRTVFRRRGWGTWAFSSRVIDSGVEVDTKLQGSRSSKTLRVVLSDSPLGIYNNAGKKFLDVNTPVDPERAGELSRSARAMLLDFTSDSMRTLDAPLLRWASAGVLPIARWRSADWVVLFFRDIRPVGWNLANGASENERDRATWQNWRSASSAKSSWCAGTCLVTASARSFVRLSSPDRAVVTHAWPARASRRNIVNSDTIMITCTFSFLRGRRMMLYRCRSCQPLGAARSCQPRVGW